MLFWIHSRQFGLFVYTAILQNTCATKQYGVFKYGLKKIVFWRLGKFLAPHNYKSAFSVFFQRYKLSICF